MAVPQGYTVPYNTSSATSPTPSPVSSPFSEGYRPPTPGGGGSGQPSAPSGGGAGGWGSFGTKANWQSEFFNVHGRLPNVQDEVDYWDSQVYAAFTGRAPTYGEWLNRYWEGSWEGGGQKNEQPHTQWFDRMVIEGNDAYPQLTQQVRDWRNSLGDTAPDWLKGITAPVAPAALPLAPGPQFNIESQLNKPKETLPAQQPTQPVAPGIGLPPTQPVPTVKQPSPAEAQRIADNLRNRYMGAAPWSAPVAWNTARPAPFRQQRPGMQGTPMNSGLFYNPPESLFK
jgi:hypothetical protein